MCFVHFGFDLGTSKLADLFHSHYHPLCDALSLQPMVIVPLSERLCATGLITDETRIQVQKSTQLSPYEQANKLLSPAIQRAQESVKEAQKFCQCLQECEIPVPESILKGEVVILLCIYNYVPKKYKSISYSFWEEACTSKLSVIKAARHTC